MSEQKGSTIFPWPFTRQTPDAPDVVQRYLNATGPDERASWRDVPYSVLDVETTGLNSRRDAMLSIGIVDIDDGRIRLDRQWYTLLRPPDHVKVSAESIRIHGLLRQDVATARPPEEVLPELLAHLTDRVLVVHFAPIDVDFISRALRSLWGVALRGPALDTIRLAETLYHRQRWTTGHDGMQMITALGPLAAQAGLPVYSEHNALSDALTTAQLFLSQAMQMERQGEGTLRRLLKAGRCLR